MEIHDSENAILSFHDPDRESAHILACWLERSGVKRSVVLEELRDHADAEEAITSIGMKSFTQWTSDVTSGKMISALSEDARGMRVVAVVRWFLQEHSHRRQPVVLLPELRRLANLYQDLPVKYRLQLKRLVHQFEIDAGLIDPGKLFEWEDWRHQYTRWSVFGFVIDYLWCLRATNILDLELVGLNRDDTRHWGWWHRLAVPVRGVTKYTHQSHFASLRGPYAQSYHLHQMKRFSHILDRYLAQQDPRCMALFNLLKQTEGFETMLEQSRELDDVRMSDQLGVPFPFFRTDGTLLWLYELTVDIPGKQGYQLVIWSPVDDDSNEYLAEIRRHAIVKSRPQERTLFIEDYAYHFSPEERLALGV